MKIKLSLLFLLILFSSGEVFSQDKVKHILLTKCDLPFGYYLKNNNKNLSKSGAYYSEYWNTMSPSEEKYYSKQKGGIFNAPVVSSISIDRYYSTNKIPDSLIEYHKGSLRDPGWVETTPNGKKLGDKCYSLTKNKNDGSIDYVLIVVKNKTMTVVTILNRKNSKSIPKESVEKLIEIIYSRL